MNKELRWKIAGIVNRAGEGHIPSSFSIVDILDVLYGQFLRVKSKQPDWDGRDYFILSKGHGAAALYVVLEKYGFITERDLEQKSKITGILGGHPDCTKVPGAEASTGSLGHGVVTAMGIALGLRIQGKDNRVVSLIGDGESNEGTVWEMALVAANLQLGNLCVILDRNHSIDQILSMDNAREKWEAFGWNVLEVDGHNEADILNTLKMVKFRVTGKPTMVVANTTKGKGVSFLEGHGQWHHKIPNSAELVDIKKELTI